MKGLLECKECYHRWWVRYIYEDDTNATVFPDDDDQCPQCKSDSAVLIDCDTDETDLYDPGWA